MPFCPKCRAEFEEGFEVCGSCNVGLVSNIEDVPEPITPERAVDFLKDKELAAIVRGSVSACKEIVDTLLSIQIPAVIIPAEDVDPRSGVAMVLDVLVAEEDLERAIGLLNDEWKDLLEKDGLQFMNDSEAEPTEEEMNHGDDEESGEEYDDDDGEEPACPACGSKEPLKEGECPNCGLYLGG